MSCGASCFSLTSRRAGIHAHEWKQNWDYATSFPIRPATSGYHSFELTRHDHCVHDCLPRRERQLVNSISNVETWTPTFPQRVVNRLASNRKDQVIECLLEQLLLRFKRKVGWRRHGQAQKFEAQEAQWKIKGWTTAAESSRSADSLEMHARAAIAGTVLHGNNAAN